MRKSSCTISQSCAVRYCSVKPSKFKFALVWIHACIYSKVFLTSLYWFELVDPSHNCSSRYLTPHNCSSRWHEFTPVSVSLCLYINIPNVIPRAIWLLRVRGVRGVCRLYPYLVKVEMLFQKDSRLKWNIIEQVWKGNTLVEKP